MIRFFIFFIFFLLTTNLFGAKVERFRWNKGEPYLVFLQKQQLPVKQLYYDLDTEDQQLTDEMITGAHYQVLKDDDGVIQQVLLPLNDELQIHIFKHKNQYHFEVIPIISDSKIEAFTLSINNSPYYDIIKTTNSKKIAQIFTSNFRNSLDFKRDLRKGDTLVMLYEQKYRIGHIFSMPTLKVAMIEMRNKQHFIYLNDDDRYYDEQGHEVEGFLLTRPVRGARISSYFTNRRYHPILKKWKAHLGVDYADRPGTPIVAAGSGMIIYAAEMGSYGNLVKIRHDDDYETRYAHMKSFHKNTKKGRYVKKGQVIGYIGTTGRSTGPHLHFELRKLGRAINPLRVVQVTTKKLKGKEKEAFLKLKEKYDQDVQLHLKNKTKFIIPQKVQDVCYFYNSKSHV